MYIQKMFFKKTFISSYRLGKQALIKLHLQGARQNSIGTLTKPEMDVLYLQHRFACCLLSLPRIYSSYVDLTIVREGLHN